MCDLFKRRKKYYNEYEPNNLYAFNKITTFGIEPALVDITGFNIEDVRKMKIFKNNISQTPVEVNVFYEDLNAYKKLLLSERGLADKSEKPKKIKKKRLSHGERRKILAPFQLEVTKCEERLNKILIIKYIIKWMNLLMTNY